MIHVYFSNIYLFVNICIFYQSQCESSINNIKVHFVDTYSHVEFIEKIKQKKRNTHIYEIIIFLVAGFRR